MPNFDADAVGDLVIDESVKHAIREEARIVEEAIVVRVHQVTAEMSAMDQSVEFVLPTVVHIALLGVAGFCAAHGVNRQQFLDWASLAFDQCQVAAYRACSGAPHTARLQ